MTTNRLFCIALITLILTILPVPEHTNAQEQCETATTITYPIDTTLFTMVQDYGVASPRHQGRFHTGEDWHLAEGQTAGQPVRAIASGVVTFSGPNGWGRDGGVIIIQHTFEDGTIIWSQYGHIADNESVTFPSRFSCVEAGEIIAVVGDSRPAPHLHFEIRVASDGTPGPGYTRADPFTMGWRRPAQFVANQQAWSQPSHLWHVINSTFYPTTPPLVLNDNSMMVIDGALLRGITIDGRVLWRVALEDAAVAITGYQGNPYITYADGEIVRVDFEGNPIERWSLDFLPDDAPFYVGNSPVYPTADNTLVALSEDQREVLWRVEDIPDFSHVHVSERLIALVNTFGDRLRILTREGTLLETVTLRDGASLTTAPDGNLIVYTEGGLWTVDGNATWQERLSDVPDGGAGSAVAVLPDGATYLLDGETVTAYDPSGIQAWNARLPIAITGHITMIPYDNGLLITSTHGHIVVVRQTGGICGVTRIFGDDRADVWHELGTDDVLRVSVGDQIIGIDWQDFAGTCAG